MLTINSTEDLIKRHRDSGLTRYTLSEIQQAADEYNAALSEYEQAHAALWKEIRGQFGQFYQPLPGTPQSVIEASKVLWSFHAPYCQVNMKCRGGRELYPLTVWAKATRKLQRQTRRVQEIEERK